MGRVSVAIVAFGLLAASCAGSNAQDTTTSSTTTTVPVAPTTSSTSTTTSAPTTTEPAQPSIPATATISLVQSELKLLGFFDGTVDGVAGELTQDALKKFQTETGIEADGVFGPQTDGELSAALEQDESYVSDVQGHLAELNLYSGPIDGDFGEGTKHAVEAFQKSCDLEETGSLNISTRLCLSDL